MVKIIDTLRTTVFLACAVCIKYWGNKRCCGLEILKLAVLGGPALERAVKVVVSNAELALLSTPGSVLSAHTVQTLDGVCAALGGILRSVCCGKQSSWLT